MPPDLTNLTMGAAGPMAASADGRACVPALDVAVEDTVGAGDSFGAALLAALLEHDALDLQTTRLLDDVLLEEALSYAVAASAITCTRIGAVPPTHAELETWIGLSLKT